MPASLMAVAVTRVRLFWEVPGDIPQRESEKKAVEEAVKAEIRSERRVPSSVLQLEVQWGGFEDRRSGAAGPARTLDATVALGPISASGYTRAVIRTPAWGGPPPA